MPQGDRSQRPGETTTVLREIEDDIPHVRLGMVRGQNDVGIVPDGTPRLEQDHLPDVVHVALQMDALVEHGFARHLTYAADNDTAAFTLGMAVDNGQGSFPAHGLLLIILRRRPNCFPHPNPLGSDSMCKRLIIVNPPVG